MVHRGAELHRFIKYWILPNISNRIKNGEIPAYFNSTISEITPGTVELNTPDGPVTLKNDFVFAMTGYHPDTEFLSRHGIEFDAETRRPRLGKRWGAQLRTAGGALWRDLSGEDLIAITDRPRR